MLLPLTQVIVFLGTTGDPAIKIFAVAVTGAKVAVPPCDAITAQFPALKRFRVDPEIEQTAGVAVENMMPAPLEAIADKATVLSDKFTLTLGENVIVCGSRETSNETVYRSDTR
jgi:hypothetical protein